MTPRQKEALDFIRQFLAEKEYSPSFNEIQEGISCSSKSEVHRLIHSLLDQGKITMLPYRSRTIEVVK